MLRLCLLALASFLVFTPAAQAQITENQAVMQQIERLQRDIQLMQRQLARGDAPLPSINPVSDDEIEDSGGAAKLDVRLSKMDEDIRALRGRVEEAEFQSRKLAEDLQRFKKDTEFRFNEIKPGSVAATPTETPTIEAERKPVNGNMEISVQPANGDIVPLNTPTSENFPTPRDHYNYAFRLLNQTKYGEAAQAFDAFTKKYPKDPLIGNAYYWEGETHYIRRDYVNAADNFRQGFEALPAGPKAADNLLKLAMSLSALDRNKESCVVLGQIVTKFKNSSASIVDKATQEQQRIGCQ